MVMESSPKNGDSVLRMLPLCKGIILGVIIGVLYCLSMQDSASLIGGRVIVPGYGESGLTASNLTTTSESNYMYSNRLVNDAYGPPLASEVERIRWILALWEASPLLNNSRNASDSLVQQARSKLGHLRLPPPHLEDCAARAEEYKRLDSRNLNGSRPLWSLWKGLVGTIDHEQNVQVENSEDIVGDKELKSGPLPPWVEGGDEDNLPMTRRVQRDIWQLQHPLNCSHESVRFLLADWPASAHLGLGAQLVYVGGLLAIAMSEKRVLVLEKLDRADHQGCQGTSRGRWSCYFLPETTQECSMRAHELGTSPPDGRVMSGKEAFYRNPWFTALPKFWGVPWEDMQPTTEIEGHLLVNYRRKYIRFWRSQAVRYFMRFSSEYTCTLMNKARHDAWGVEAATMVLRASQAQELGLQQDPDADLEKWIWKSHRPWVPRPLLSLHVRLGDKAKEMTMVKFDKYMALANRFACGSPSAQHLALI